MHRNQYLDNISIFNVIFIVFAVFQKFEWLLLSENAGIFFLATLWREQIRFQWEYDEVCFVLTQSAELEFYCASSLKQQSAGRHVASLRHIIMIPSQPVLLFLFIAAFLAEKQQIPKVFGLTRLRTHDLPHSRQAR